MTNHDEPRVDRLRARLLHLGSQCLIAMVLLMLVEQAAWAASGLPAGWHGTADRRATEALTASRGFVEGSVREVQQAVTAAAAAEHRRQALLQHEDRLQLARLATAKPAASGAIGPDPGRGHRRLPGHVLAALDSARPLARLGPLEGPADEEPLTLTVLLRRDDAAGFARYLASVQDPASPQFRRYQSPLALSDRFGPSRSRHERVVDHFRRHGFTVVDPAPNRLTVTVRGTRRAAEAALAVDIRDFRIGDVAFRANVDDPALPARLASSVESISGLSNLATPRHAVRSVSDAQNLCAIVGASGALAVNGAIFVGGVLTPVLFTPLGAAVLALLALVCITALVYGAAYGPSGGGGGGGATGAPLVLRADAAAGDRAATGRGQTVGIVAFDNFDRQDMQDYFALIGAPATRIDDLSVVAVNGGAPRGVDEAEVLLDISTVMTLAPGARAAVYSAPFDGRATSYVTVFNAMVNGGVSVISNSWASCEDQVSLAEAQAIDRIFETAAASGISVFNASGDSGSTCLNGSPNTAAVPASSPNATAVGGTSLRFGPGGTYGSETYWNDAPIGGAGGYGLSRHFTRPAYQNGLNANAMRSIPDVAVNADPDAGVMICQARDGGCPSGRLYGGTSLSAPIWAGFAALLNERAGRNLGAFNPLLYPLAASDAFHRPASLGSDFAHVGLGSPNLNVLGRLLRGQAPGALDAGASQVTPVVPLAAVQRQSGGIQADGVEAGGVLVRVVDGNGNTLAGRSVSLTASGGTVTITPATAVTSIDNGSASFRITALAPAQVTLSATVDGTPLAQTAPLPFVTPAATAASITALTTTAVNDGVATVPITVTLRDALGRPTPGKRVAIAQGAGRSLIAGPASGATGADGTIVFNVSSTVAETVTYTARVLSDGNLPVPGSVAITFGGTASTSCAGGPPTPAPGYAITPYSNGYLAQAFFFGNVNFGCSGASNPTFDTAGNAYVANFRTGDLHRLPPGGGAATPATRLSNLGLTLGQPIFGRDGNLYATRSATTGDFRTGDLIQIDPATGALLRVVAANLTCPGGLTEDPLSGDLFFNGGCFGGGSDVASIFRVRNPAAAGGQPSTLSIYATLPRTPNFGMAFAPDGTLFAMSGYLDDAPPVLRISGTNRPQPATVQPVPGLATRFSAAIGEADAAGAARSLLVDPGSFEQRALSIADITAAAPALTSLLAPASAGTTGPDGCQYLTAADAIYRLAPISGPCRFAPTVALPSLVLTPDTVSPNPAQGSAQTLTATLRNVAAPAGLPILFTVAGANPQVKLVRAGADGLAALSYRAVNPGRDTITATVQLPSTAAPTAPSGRRTAGIAPRAATLPASAAATRSGDGIAYAASTAAAGRAGIPAIGVRQPAVAPPVPSAARSVDPASRVAGGEGATAGAEVGTLVSNTAEITWTVGPHTSFLSLNPSPVSGTPGQPVTVAAALADVSNAPATPATGQIVDFTLGASSCRATTDAAGLARCALTPAAVGPATLRASFAGTAALLPASASIGFVAMAAPPPVPTVSLSVAPTTITLGQSAVLTWSSTNAGGCSASGAWSNSRATSGSETVTPTAIGSAIYTLSCTGSGGTTAASATLTVTAAPPPPPPPRRKGGAFDGAVLLGLMLLAGLLRRRRGQTPAR